MGSRHPEEARKLEEERKKEQKKAEKRRYGGKGSRGGNTEPDRDWGAYYAGQKAGADIGLDPQTENSSARRKIAHA